MKAGTRILTVLALTSALASVGCGGSGGGSDSGSTAAGARVQTMAQARADHTAVLLPSGEILVAGGVDAAGNPLRSTVIVSATSLRPGPDMGVARRGHTATVLGSGQVLITGGQSTAAVAASTELFDPLTETFSPGPSLIQPRAGHVALNYFDGAAEKVLIASGWNLSGAQGSAAALASAELYDVATGVVTPLAASLSQAQFGARIARLDTGGLLIVGGQVISGSSTAPASPQLFRPQSQTFTPLAAQVVRSGAAVASRGGEVLVAGGRSSAGIEASTEVFDSATSTFAMGVSLSEARELASATVAGNSVVVAGGRTAAGASATVEKVEGVSMGQATVTAHVALQDARYAHTALSTASNLVVVVGGYDTAGVPLATIETIDLNATVAPPAGTTTPGSTTPGTTTPGSLPTGGGLPGGLPGGGLPGGGIVGGGTGGGTGGTGSTGGSSGGLSGLLGSLFGGGSGSAGSSILNTIVQSAIQALTASAGSGGGMSGFLQAFMTSLTQNLLGGSGGSGGLLSSLLGSLFGGGSGSGTTGGGSGGLSGLLSGLLGGLFGGGSGSGSGSGSGTTTPGTTAGLQVTSMTPGQGSVGDTVTIVATGFGSTVGVSFNGEAAAISSARANGQGVLTVVCTVPAAATTGQVLVSSGGNVASAGVFTVF